MIRIALLILVTLSAGCADCPPDRTGVITRHNGTTLEGVISYSPASKTYLVDGTQPIEVPSSEVTIVKVRKPSLLPQAIALVESEKYRDAIPILQSILEEYNMLQWDIEAARLLATCHLRLKQPNEALGVLRSPAKRASGTQQESLQLLAIEAKLDLGDHAVAQHWAKSLSPANQKKYKEMEKRKTLIQDVLQ